MNTISKKNVRQSSVREMRQIRVRGSILLTYRNHEARRGTSIFDGDKDMYELKDLVLTRYEAWRNAFRVYFSSSAEAMVRTKALTKAEEQNRNKTLWLFLELLAFARRSDIGRALLLQFASETISVVPDVQLLVDFLEKTWSDKFYKDWRAEIPQCFESWIKRVEPLWEAAGGEEVAYENHSLTERDREEIFELLHRTDSTRTRVFLVAYVLSERVSYRKQKVEREHVNIFCQGWKVVRGVIDASQHVDPMNPGYFRPHSQ